MPHVLLVKYFQKPEWEGKPASLKNILKTISLVTVYKSNRCFQLRDQILISLQSVEALSIHPKGYLLGCAPPMDQAWSEGISGTISFWALLPCSGTPSAHNDHRMTTMSTFAARMN